MNLIRLLIMFVLCSTVLISAHARTVVISEQLEMHESSQVEDPSLVPFFPLNDIFLALQLLNVPGEYQELTNSYEAPARLESQESHNLLHTNLPPPVSIL